MFGGLYFFIENKDFNKILLKNTLNIKEKKRLFK